jgi:hypothetical protein
MKKGLTAIIMLICIFFTYNLFIEKTENEKVQEKYLEYQKEHPFYKTLQLSKEERKAKEMTPDKYFEEKYLLEMNPYTGRTHPENIFNVRETLKAMRLNQKSPGDGSDGNWEERGPNNVGGRTRAVLFDPNDATHKRVFAGGVSGGLWVNEDITDAASSWTQLGIDENLAITCIAVDPNNSQIMYVGTGELYTNRVLGNGIWRSIDGGATWTSVYKISGTTTLTSTQTSVPGTYYTTDIIVRDADGSNATTNDSEVFIGVGARGYSSNPQGTFIGVENYGIFKSTDTGTNWNRVVLNHPTANKGPEAPNDFEIGSDNTLWLSTTSNVYAGDGGRVYSSANGSTFTLKHTVPNGIRTEIAVSKTSANKIYILAQLTTTANPVGIYLTTDGFATTPTTLALPNDADDGIPANDFTRGQAFYDLMLAIDPTNDAIAYVGGIDLFRTATSGAAWSQISKWSNNNNLANLTIPTVHADQHGWAFHPTNANIAINGNDGGVYYASDLSGASSSTTAISARNKDYNVTQFYNGAIGQSTNTEYLLAGAQDNGTQFVNNASPGINSTIMPSGGDGAYSFIDKDGAYMTFSYVHNVMYRRNLPYNENETNVTISNDKETGSFINPQDLDDNLDILYSNGTSKLFKFSNITTDNPTKTEITGGSLLTNITAIKVSPFTTASSKVFVGTSTGTLAKVENANTASPTITKISPTSFVGSISSVEFGASEDEILVTFYNFGVTSIWYTSNGTAGTPTWTSKEGDFPDIPVKAILMNSLYDNEVIIGTELGVWTTSNFKAANPNWKASNNGMSNVPVTSFDLRTIDHTILVTTYGRGMFTGKFTRSGVAATCLPPSAITTTSITGTTASVGWTEAGTATTWDIEWGTSGFDRTGTPTITGTTTNPHSLTGLTQGTTYDFYVRANCGGGNSTWSGAYTFTTTSCTTVNTFPFTETFETASSTLNCWTQVQEEGNEDWTFANGSGGNTSAHGGTQNARFVSLQGTGTKVTKLVSPILDLSSLPNAQLRFYYGQEAYIPETNKTKVYYSTDSGASWTEIASYTAATSSWTEEKLTLPNPSANYMIAFEGIGIDSYGYANVIDDVVIEESTASCTAVNTFPFTETFEATSSTLNCWTQVQEEGNEDWTFANGSGYTINSAHGGSQNARFVSLQGTGTPVTKLVSPILDLSSVPNAQLRFYYGQETYSADTNETKVYYSTDSGETWIEIAHYTAAISSWTEETLTLPNPSANYMIAFEGINNWGYSNVIDDVVIEESTTSCTAVNTFPFTETFEATSSTLNCWTQIEEIGDEEWTPANGSGENITSAHGGSQNVKFVSMEGDGTPVTKLVSPTLDLSSVPNAQLRFYYGQEDWNGDQNETKVYYSSDSGETWTEIAHYTAAISSWTEETLTLPNLSANYKIAFEGINNYGYSNVIDDVVIEESTLSIDEVVGLENVSIYKTAARTLRITGLQQNNSKTNVTLFNLIGKQVLNTSFQSNGVKDISLPQTAIGVYIVKIQTEKGNLSKKIILE